MFVNETSWIKRVLLLYEPRINRTLIECIVFTHVTVSRDNFSHLQNNERVASYEVPRDGSTECLPVVLDEISREMSNVSNLNFH